MSRAGAFFIDFDLTYWSFAANDRVSAVRLQALFMTAVGR